MSYNGPVFPIVDGQVHGLTKREWFAGQALVMIPESYAKAYIGVEEISRQLAKHAYAIADAMLEYGEKQ